VKIVEDDGIDHVIAQPQLHYKSATTAIGANRIHTWMLAGGSHEAFEFITIKKKKR
jgi:hypothetical protein